MYLYSTKPSWDPHKHISFNYKPVRMHKKSCWKNKRIKTNTKEDWQPAEALAQVALGKSL